MISYDVAKDVRSVVQDLRALGSRHIPFATARTLTALAKSGQAETEREMRSVFDRPTAYALRSLVVKPATKAQLEASVGLKDTSQNKQSRSPLDVLGHEFTGGQRKFKAFEGALRRMGYLPNGWAVVPGDAAQLDAFGNMPASFIVKLMSYLQAFSEQGYSANATAKGKARTEKRGRSARGFATINGVAYFISRGKGNWFGAGSWQHGRSQHLPPGIWAKRGIHGADVQPIVRFVRVPVYRQRIHLEQNVARVVDRDAASEFFKNLNAAMGGGR